MGKKIQTIEGKGSNYTVNKGGVMTAQDLINNVVIEEYRGRAHVRALIEDKDSWWHVHRDEELPQDYPTVVYVRM